MAAAGGEIGKVVNVNVGGILYTTTLATLTKVRLVKFYRIDNVKYVYPSSQRLALTTIEQFSAQPPWPTSQWLYEWYMKEKMVCLIYDRKCIENVYPSSQRWLLTAI